MSTRAAVASLVIALALCSAAYVLLGRSEPATVPGPLLDFRPSQARALRVDRGGEQERVERRGEADDWVVILGSSGAWPASAAPVRGALRILSTLEPFARAERGQRPEEGAAVVTLTLDDGTTRAMRLGSRAMSGRVLVELIDPGPARPDRKGAVYWADRGIAEVLAATGLGAWRDTGVFGSLGPEVARVTVAGAGGTIALARVGGSWALREPVAAPADEQAVLSLIRALAALRVSDFGDRGLVTAPGSRAPLASITVETDAREPAGVDFVTRTTVRRVDFTGLSGLAGDQVLARLRRHERVGGPGGEVDTGEFMFAVPLAALAELPSTPEGFVSRTACRTPAADAGGVSIRRADNEGGERSLVRTLDGWADARADGTRVPAPREAATAAEALLRALCGARADAVAFAPPEGWTPRWSVELRTFGGDPLEAVEVGRAGEGWIVRSGPVWRTYGPGGADLGLALAGIGP